MAVMMTRGRQKNTILQLKSCSVPKIVIDQLLNKLADFNGCLTMGDSS